MDAGPSPTRHARAQHRHELRTLTYATLDQANGGIVRNLTSSGIGVQVVAAVRPKQQIRIRFELRYPRLRVETTAEVVWATFSGQCGIRFLDMPPALRQQINHWIFGDLLEGISLHIGDSESMFAPKHPVGPTIAETGKDKGPIPAEEEDGLMVSASPVKVIQLPTPREAPQTGPAEESTVAEIVPDNPPAALDWLSQPLSGRALAWTVDTLVVAAALLLFTLVFLSVTREAPPWPLATVAAASLAMAGMYWVFFRVLAGRSLGATLARIAETETDSEDGAARFR